MPNYRQLLSGAATAGGAVGAGTWGALDQFKDEPWVGDLREFMHPDPRNRMGSTVEPAMPDDPRAQGWRTPWPIERGNIDLTNRPRVRNPDGSISTVRSMNTEVNGREVLMPTVSEDGRIMSDDEAVDQYMRTGRHLGIFGTPDAAEAYAKKLHDDQAREYLGSTVEPGAYDEGPAAAQDAREVAARRVRGELAPSAAVERRWGEFDAPSAPPGPSRADAFEMGGLADMGAYKEAPATVWRDTDVTGAERDVAPDPYMNPFAASPQQIRVAQAHAGPVDSLLIPTSPVDLALMSLGPAGKIAGVPGKIAAMTAGLMASGIDPAEAGVLGKAGKAGKAIGSLFDYSKIRDVPDVKQFDLPRYDPPRGVSERVQELVKNKDVERQMLEHIQKGKDINAETFYYNEPLRQAFIDELGKKKGPQGFERYMDYVAATSPRSDVATNARNASYYYMLEKQGLPVPPQGGVNPQPYGHMAQNLHRENAEKIRSGEYFDVTKNPKPLSFSQNLQGNFAPVTVDAHALKLPAMLARDPNFIAGSIKLEKGQPTINPSKMLESGEITMDDAFNRPVFWSGKPNANEYGAMEQYYKRLANEAGMTPAQTQAAAWAGGGKITGLESVAGDPFMRAVENRAIKTAEERGISPAEALSQMMRGKAPLLGTAGAVPLGAGMMGGVADQENYNY